MLTSLEEIFKTNSIEINAKGDRIYLHSNTSKEQGLFLQEMFDIVKPQKSLEVGFAYGISTLFILEKHREINAASTVHIAMDPDEYWGTAAMHNIKKEGLEDYLDIRRDFSDNVLTQLFHEKYRFQFAYIDTTKQFDVVMQDFYFINKMLDINGIIVLDDCGGGWPGIQRVARFINTLPNYKVAGTHNKIGSTVKKRIAHLLIKNVVKLIPFKSRFYPTIDFKTDVELGLNYSCIAFQKIAFDARNWDWDKAL